MFHWTVSKDKGPKGVYPELDPSEGPCHAAVTVGSKVYSFGGSSAGETDCAKRQIGVNVFNALYLSWTTLPLVKTGRWRRPPEVPSRRRGHTAVLIDHIVYIWGGRPHLKLYTRVLYAFDVDTCRWFGPKVSGTVPKSSRGHSACALGKVMYVHGGDRYGQWSGQTNYFHKLDTTTMVWSFINAEGRDLPSDRSGHTCTIIGTKMFVFGGVGNYSKDKINVFDTENNCWLITPSAHLPRVLKRRRGHSALAYNGELYIHGGYCKSHVFDDMWKFDPETLSWKEIKPTGKGPPTDWWLCRVPCCMVGDRIIFARDNPNDLYILNLTAPSLKTLCKLAVIQYGLELSGLPHNIRWELAGMTTTTGVCSLSTSLLEKGK